MFIISHEYYVPIYLYTYLLLKCLLGIILGSTNRISKNISKYMI